MLTINGEKVDAAGKSIWNHTESNKIVNNDISDFDSADLYLYYCMFEFNTMKDFSGNIRVWRYENSSQNMINDPSDDFYANPIKDDMFCWHFTIRGPPDTEFEGGLYHGIIKLPMSYPNRPPSIMFLTPNGRFDVNMDVCLSMTRYLLSVDGNGHITAWRKVLLSNEEDDDEHKHNHQKHSYTI